MLLNRLEIEKRIFIFYSTLQILKSLHIGNKKKGGS